MVPLFSCRRVEKFFIFFLLCECGNEKVYRNTPPPNRVEPNTPLVCSVGSLRFAPL